jgi:hypothetical protein
MHPTLLNRNKICTIFRFKSQLPMKRNFLTEDCRDCQKRKAEPVENGEQKEQRLSLLKPWLMDSGTTVAIPFDNRVVFVRPLHCAQFPSRLSEVAQLLDTISRIEFLVSGLRSNERRPPGTV